MTQLEAEILNHLDTHAWSNLLDVKRNIAKSRPNKKEPSFAELYPAFRRLERKDLIAGAWEDELVPTSSETSLETGCRRRVYRLTEGGRQALNQQLNRSTPTRSRWLRWLPV